MALKAAAIGVSIKLATKLFSKFASVAVGSFQLIKGVMGGVKTGLGGVVGLLSKRFPGLAKRLPAGLGKIAGAVTAAEKVTANPVRVVNFDEMGGGLGAGLGGPAAGPGGGAAGPGFLGQDIRGFGGATTKLGKVMNVAGKSAGVLGAALVGWQLGKAIDQTFGLSDKISNLAFEAGGAGEQIRKATRAMLEIGATQIAAGAGAGSVAAQAKMFARFAEAGIKVQEKEKGGKLKRVAVTQEFIRAKIRKRFEGTVPKEQMAQLLTSVQSLIEKVPTKDELDRIANRPVKAEITSREVARATAGATNENRSRTTGKTPTARPRTAAAR
jgi:hypothetical protein